MKTKPNIKIVIIEDDDFYNRLLTKYLSFSLNKLSQKSGFTLIVISCLSFTEFIDNFDNETIFVFSDYYIGGKNTAFDVIKFIESKSKHCKIAIVTQIKSHEEQINKLLKKSYNVINKDVNTLYRCKQTAEQVIQEWLKVNFVN